MKAKQQPKNIKHRQRWVNQLKKINQFDKKDFDFLDFQSAIEGPIAIILLHGPPNSPYEGYTFRLEYDGSEIPFKPPNVRFIDIPWNPFVNQNTGEICCDILIDQWSPALVLKTVVLSISSLLNETKLPQGEPGLNIQAAGEMNASYAHFFDIARQYASEHHYTQGHHYKDDEKPPAFAPLEQKIEDGQLQEKKEKFVNDPENIEKREKKIKHLENKKKGINDDDQDQKGNKKIRLLMDLQNPKHFQKKDDEDDDDDDESGSAQKKQQLNQGLTQHQI